MEWEKNEKKLQHRSSENQKQGKQPLEGHLGLKRKGDPGSKTPKKRQKSQPGVTTIEAVQKAATGNNAETFVSECSEEQFQQLEEAMKAAKQKWKTDKGNEVLKREWKASEKAWKIARAIRKRADSEGGQK